MAHNPPPLPNPGPDGIRKLVKAVERDQSTVPWSSLSELADRIERKARAGKRVTLLPETALIVAEALRKR